METTAKKIENFLHQNRLSQTAVAKALGIDQTTVSGWARGKSEPSLEMAKKLLEVYGLDVLGGEPRLDLDDDCVYVKFYEDIKASAGCGVDNHCEGYELVKIDRKLLNPKVNPAKHHAIRASGDSMEPTIKDGDVIFVEPFAGDFANNRVYIIKRQDDVFVKRLKKEPTGYEIISDNPDYLPYKLKDNEIQIIGRVV